MTTEHVTRRVFTLGSIGGAGALLAAACGSDRRGGTAPDAHAGSCTLYPAETEGPYYLDLNDLRRDVSEGKPGTPLSVQIRVVSADDCTPVAGAAVDIWHCDADGVYSGYPGQLGGLDTTGQTFLRGTQVTDADGVAQFDTIYPGWYPGRTTHIHAKVHVTTTTEATSQLYFDEALTQAVYDTAPYSAHGQKDTSNAGDGTAGGHLPTLLAITGDASGYLATITFTVG